MMMICRSDPRETKYIVQISAYHSTKISHRLNFKLNGAIVLVVRGYLTAGYGEEWTRQRRTILATIFIIMDHDM